MAISEHKYTSLFKEKSATKDTDTNTTSDEPQTLLEQIIGNLQLPENYSERCKGWFTPSVRVNAESTMLTILVSLKTIDTNRVAPK